MLHQRRQLTGASFGVIVQTGHLLHDFAQYQISGKVFRCNLERPFAELLGFT